MSPFLKLEGYKWSLASNRLSRPSSGPEMRRIANSRKLASRDLPGSGELYMIACAVEEGGPNLRSAKNTDVLVNEAARSIAAALLASTTQQHWQHLRSCPDCLTDCLTYMFDESLRKSGGYMKAEYDFSKGRRGQATPTKARPVLPSTSMIKFSKRSRLSPCAAWHRLSDAH